MTPFIETLNRWSEQFLNFAWPMLWQSSLLIALIFVLDLALRRKLRAAIRYALWLMVLLKLLLPPSLALPTSLAWWLLPAPPSPAKLQITPYVITYGNQTTPVFPVQSQPIPPPLQPKISIAAWTLVVSGVVSAGLLVWLLFRWRQINQKLRRAKPSEKLIPIQDDVRRLARLRPGIRLKLTEDSMSPAVCGLFRPVILLPRSLVGRLSTGQLRAVLLHEAIHLRRGDVWVNCAQALVQIVYWWHPLLWLANARIRRVREEAVDDAVMLALRDDAEIYAPTLLEVAKLAFNRPLASLGLVGILESRSALRQRIERLMDFNAPRKAGLTIVSILGILAFSAVALPMGQAPLNTNAPSNSLIAGNYVAPLELETFRIDRRMNENDLQKLLLNAGVKIPPTELVYEDNASYVMLLARGSEEQLGLIRREVFKLNGFSSKVNGTNRLAKMTAPSPRTNPTATNLEMRAFRVSDMFVAALRNTPGLQSNDVPTMAKSLFRKLGVDLTAPGRSIAYNDKLGLLFIKATPSEMDTIERVIQALNEFNPQIHIKARFIEVPKAEVGAIWKAGTRVDTGDKIAVEIITADKMKPLLHQLESTVGTETWAEPEAVTSGGWQTQMRATAIESVVTNYAFHTDTYPAVTPQVGKFEIGPTVDIVPYVLADGYTVNLTAEPQLLEFLGYVKNPDTRPVTNEFGVKILLPTVLPHFRVRKADATVNLWDGQTLVLGNFKSIFVAGGKETSGESKFGADAEKKNGTADKELLVFITATIVDPAGNRVHSDKKLPFNPSTIPPQPKFPTPSP